MLGIDGLIQYLSSGGWVMAPMVLMTMVLWYALGYRFSILRGGQGFSAKAFVKGKIQDSQLWSEVYSVVGRMERVPKSEYKSVLHEELYSFDERIKSCSTVIKLIVVCAPLLGLLGTVMGMIETFDSLAEMSLHSSSGGGVSGGISQALVSTQMGLIVAIPGLVLGRQLDTKQNLFANYLHQISDHLAVQAFSEVPQGGSCD